MQQQQQQQQMTQIPDVPRTPCQTLMVVDDDEILRESIASLFQTRGFRVIEHDSGETAFAALAHGLRPDLILLDLAMPTMNGWEFRERQLATPAVRSIPVVALSGDQSAQARAVNAAAFVAKPMTAAALVTTVEEVLAKHARDVRLRSRTRPGRRRTLRSQPHGTRLREIRENEQRRLQFAYVSAALSHVVNNTLQSLISYAQCAGSREEQDPELERSTIEGAFHCASVLREFSKCAQLSDASENRQDMIAHLPLSMLEGWRRLCPPRVNLRVSGLQRLTPSCIASDVLQGLISALIANAVEAVGTNTGTVSVVIDHRLRHMGALSLALPARNRRSRTWCCVAVSDDGEGMGPTALRRMWWPFYTTRFPGRGLGLSKVLATISGLGGLVEADSTLGRGTTVRLLLPL